MCSRYGSTIIDEEWQLLPIVGLVLLSKSKVKRHIHRDDYSQSSSVSAILRKRASRSTLLQLLAEASPITLPKRIPLPIHKHSLTTTLRSQKALFDPLLARPKLHTSV